MISKKEVEHIAKLARLELTEKEIEKMRKDMSAILNYFNLLKKAPKVKIARPVLANKIARPVLAKALEDQARKDEAKPRDAGVAEKIIAAAPDKKDDYIKVKAIL
jgi:aspartyl-tRNA(Asn)/glutamyl-tRNA(Gln) amidotransferase subunit C